MKKLISTIIALVILLTLSGCGNTQKANWSEHLEAGQKFLLDGNYEQAIIEFNKVIEIEPRNVDAYLGLADAYVAQGDYEKAIEVLEKGYAETESSEIQRRIDELKGIAAPHTEVTEQTEPPVTTVTEVTTDTPVTTVTEETTESTTFVDPDQFAEDFAWTLENGVLTISGHGRMPYYDSTSSTPWYNIREEISQVIIENGITSVGGCALHSCSNVTSVSIPDSVTRIEDTAFALCTSLDGVIIPDSVTYIGSYAFYCCNSLTSIIIPDSVTYIAHHAFPGCSSLSSLTISNSITSIGLDAFSDCDSLTSVTIPDSVTSIGYYAFSFCENLTSITIPDSVTIIGYRAFFGCKIKTIYGKSGSYAEQYASENNIQFVAE